MNLEQAQKYVAATAAYRKLQELDWPEARALVPATSTVVGALVASALLGLAAAKAFMPHSSLSLPLEPEETQPVPIGEAPPRLSEFPSILDRNLFNSEGASADAEKNGAKPACELKKSDLPLRLVGIIYGGRANASLIVLESANKQVDSFMLHDVIPGDAQVKDITRDRAILNRNGCEEFLEIIAPEAPKRRVAGERPKAAAGAGGGGEGGEVTYREEGFERSGTKTLVTRQWVERALTTNFAETLQDVKADPNIVNGQVKGFVLTRMKPNSVYEKMGLQDGDVVESINGVELNDIAGAIQTLNTMRSESNFALVVKRGGQTMDFKAQVR